MKSKTGAVGRILALVAVGQWVTFQLLLRNWDRAEVAARFFLGNDFAYLYNAAGLFLSGKSPYSEKSFIPLPPALYFPMALHHLDFWNALIAFRTINFVLRVLAMLWLCRELRLTVMNCALVLVISLTYAPLYSLLAGGNLDGLMLVMIVFACARNAWGQECFAGAVDWDEAIQCTGLAGSAVTTTMARGGMGHRLSGHGDAAVSSVLAGSGFQRSASKLRTATGGE